MLKKKCIWLWIIKFGRRWRRLIHFAIVMSCLELPNKGLGRGELLLGSVVIKIGVGQ